MQKVVYFCDHCSEEIGAAKHLTLQVASNTQTSGVAVPPKAENASWRVHPEGIAGRWFHLHGRCIGAFFNQKLKEAK